MAVPGVDVPLDPARICLLLCGHGHSSVVVFPATRCVESDLRLVTGTQRVSPTTGGWYLHLPDARRRVRTGSQMRRIDRSAVVPDLEARAQGLPLASPLCGFADLAPSLAWRFMAAIDVEVAFS